MKRGRLTLAGGGPSEGSPERLAGTLRQLAELIEGSPGQVVHVGELGALGDQAQRLIRRLERGRVGTPGSEEPATGAADADAVNAVLEGVSETLGEEFFRALVQQLAAVLRVRFAFASEVHPTVPGRVSLHTFWHDGDFGSSFEYDTEGTPCADVFANGVAYYPAGVRRLFSEDRWLEQHGVESYLAIAIYDRGRTEPLGHLGVMHDAPMGDGLPRESLLRVFAGRAGAELKRARAEAALCASLDKLGASEAQLHLLAQRQAAIREEERKRVGFDLHDNVCQELMGIGIMVETVSHQLEEASPARAAELSKVVTYVNEVVEHLRVLAHDLRPFQLRDLGLEESLQALARGMSSPETSVETVFRTDIPRLEEWVEVNLYRIAQEAISNAVRHATPHSVVLTLSASGDTLRLEVRDDGAGFDVWNRRRDSIGIASMEERALVLGGVLDVSSERECGTTIRLECPFAPASTGCGTVAQPSSDAPAGRLGTKA